ncbi:barstar family protein [Nocardioides deserti]|uniref:Barstar family protein n=1 Tax=Nocardioides deserti TaxID=1588644 RepID=A0ABR6U304_9ACTN|nr:barstar family protein [Nocardioides deserti]MBC2958760.1 barstar family protein [Nocardioides deserti]GGO69738.1 hypothetical protein GCM10012276_06660 [Nocardioides deserti]
MSAPDDFLADLLAGRVPPGVHRWEVAYAVADVRATLERAGWRLFHLDGRAHPSRAETLEALGEALALPSWWGRNLDALADCLRDLAAEPGTGRTALLWDGWGVLHDQDPRTVDVVLRLLAGAGLTVLLRGPSSTGPDATDR